MQVGGHRDRRQQKFALLDDADAERVSDARWAYLRGYASSRVNGDRLPSLLHRVLMGLPPGDVRQVDHINRNRLDNRRSNLRVVTGAQNWQNTPSRGRTSRHRGVSWSAARGKWVAQAQLNGVQRNLGRYATEEEAAAVAARFRAEHMPFAEAA